MACGSDKTPPAADAGNQSAIDAAASIDSSVTPDAAPDPCDTTVCECTQDSECAQFEVCDTTSTPGRVCVCSPTYTDTGAGCSFAGAPADPGFQADNVWTTTDPVNALLDPAATGSVDTGSAKFSFDGVCDLDAIFQTFAMPRRDRSEAFVVDVTYKTVGESLLGPALLINNGWHTLPSARGPFQTHSVCLGDGGYGGDVEFRITTAFEGIWCEDTPDTSIEVDRISVRTAVTGECPDVGTALNGDMEADNGWTFALADGGTAGYEAAIGVGGTRGIRLTRATTFSAASATTQVSLPSTATMQSAAIEFHATGTAAAVLEVQLNGRPITRLSPNGTRRVCVPDWAKGTVQGLTFALTTILDTGSPASMIESVDLDAVSVVHDPLCGAVAQNTDNGFETFFDDPVRAPGWAVTVAGVNGDITSATILNSTGAARTGDGSIQLSANNRCNESFARRDILVPAAAAGAGPAVRVFVNSGATVGDVGLRYWPHPWRRVATEAGVTAGYQEVILCIPSRYAGRLLPIEMFATGGGGGCSSVTEEVSLFDDLAITTDPSCPE